MTSTNVAKFLKTYKHTKIFDPTVSAAKVTLTSNTCTANFGFFYGGKLRCKNVCSQQWAHLPHRMLWRSFRAPGFQWQATWLDDFRCHPGSDSLQERGHGTGHCLPPAPSAAGQLRSSASQGHGAAVSSCAGIAWHELPAVPLPPPLVSSGPASCLRHSVCTSAGTCSHSDVNFLPPILQTLYNKILICFT